MIQNGYSLCFKGDLYKIYVNGLIIANVKMEQENFPIQWKYTKDVTMKV